MKVLILARGGSKGVPNKNIKLLNGKSLICYPIEAALKSSLIEKIYVSTDSTEIAYTASRAGAIIIKRPTELAQDNSLDIDGFKHAVKYLGSYEPLIHLRATTPLIEANVLDEAITLFEENIDSCSSLRSAHELSETAYKFFKQEGKYWSGIAQELIEEYGKEYYNLPRQKLPKTFCPNGYIDIVKPDVFMNGNSFHGPNILSFITPRVIEIDTLEDFERLEQKVLNEKINK